MIKEEIKEKFNNSSNMYYGHGMGAYSEDKKLSIFENGLRCSHDQLYFTTITLGKGAQTLFEEKEELLNNWEHERFKTNNNS